MTSLHSRSYAKHECRERAGWRHLAAGARCGIAAPLLPRRRKSAWSPKFWMLRGAQMTALALLYLNLSHGHTGFAASFSFARKLISSIGFVGMRRSNFLYIVTATAVMLSLLSSFVFIARTGLPSADVLARQAANQPVIKVSDFNPGEVEIVSLNNRQVIIWRRSEAEMVLAAIQNTPENWRYQSSKVLGQTESVFADDSNLTLNNEWFFALAELSNKFQHLVLRAGDFKGFLEGRNVTHFDLAGRVRKGGNNANLTVIGAEYVDSGQGIRLFLNGRP